MFSLKEKVYFTGLLLVLVALFIYGNILGSRITYYKCKLLEEHNLYLREKAEKEQCQATLADLITLSSGVLGNIYSFNHLKMLEKQVQKDVDNLSESQEEMMKLSTGDTIEETRIIMQKWGGDYIPAFKYVGHDYMLQPGEIEVTEEEMYEMIKKYENLK